MGSIGPFAGARPRRGHHEGAVRRRDRSNHRLRHRWPAARATSSPKRRWLIEMGADAADIGHAIHAHPTLSETVGMAAEMFEGTITDLFIPKKKTA